MADIPKKLVERMARRSAGNSLRRLSKGSGLVDFSSNDYLGFSRNRVIFDRTSRILAENHISQNGATGSRLLSGNHSLYEQLEKKLAEFHETETALVFNSGYDANIGFFGCVPQRGDIVFYDEYVHASIRDGIKMGNAKSYKFGHNDLGDLKKKGQTVCPPERNGQGGKGGDGAEERSLSPSRRQENDLEVRSASSAEVPVPSAVEVYVVTESVFSMDGDSPDLKGFAEFCGSTGYHLIVDEAHAVGVFGNKGEGLVQQLGLQDAVFARTVTFGKAMGCHGAAILGSKALRNYLVNFARSLIYTTGLPPHSVATILSAYDYLSASVKNAPNGASCEPVWTLSQKIEFFNLELEARSLNTVTAIGAGNIEGLNPAPSVGSPQPSFIPGNSAIHCCIIPGNERVKAIAENIRENGFDVKAILSPTVPEGRERLRICLHSFNTEEQIGRLLEQLSKAIKST